MKGVNVAFLISEAGDEDGVNAAENHRLVPIVLLEKLGPKVLLTHVQRDSLLVDAANFLKFQQNPPHLVLVDPQVRSVRLQVLFRHEHNWLILQSLFLVFNQLETEQALEFFCANLIDQSLSVVLPELLVIKDCLLSSNLLKKQLA